MKGIDLLLPLAADPDEARLLQQVQVMGDAGLPNGEALRDVAGIQVPLLEPLQNLPPGRIAQGLEHQRSGFHGQHLERV